MDSQINRHCQKAALICASERKKMTTEKFLTELGVDAPGKIICEPVNCGAGLAVETDGGSNEDSYMLVTEGVGAKSFRAFLSALAKTGRKETFHREFNGNIFAEFENGGGIIYTYFTEALGTARIIFDCVSTPLKDFNSSRKETRNDTSLMQFALKYGKMIRHKSCDCGMLYAFRLRDNSLIVIDGGESEQATEEACDEIMERFYDMTKQDKSEKLCISLWICTHNHDDHMDVFVKLLRREHEHLILERVMFNFPSMPLMKSDYSCTERMKKRIGNLYPDVKYLKPHTGETVEMPGAQIEILTTHEDILPCSYRARFNTPYRGMNESTTVFKVWFDDCTAIFLGDAEETNGEALIALYGKTLLSAEFLQCAHHLINDDKNIYASIKAKKLLIPQCRYIGNTHDRDNTSFLTGIFGAENMYYAGDCTYVFNVHDGVKTVELFEQKGYYFDGSEL